MLFAPGDHEKAAYNIRRGLDLMPEWVTSGNNMSALDGAERAFAMLSRSNPEDPLGPHFLAEIEKIRQYVGTQK